MKDIQKVILEKQKQITKVDWPVRSAAIRRPLVIIPIILSCWLWFGFVNHAIGKSTIYPHGSTLSL